MFSAFIEQGYVILKQTVPVDAALNSVHPTILKADRAIIGDNIRLRLPWAKYGYEPGDVLLYGLDTWHRGTPVLPGHVTHNLMLSTPSSDVQQRGLLQKMYYGDVEKFISGLEPHQLWTLGFPSPDDPRWLSKSFVKGIKARYQWAGLNCMEHLGRTLPPPVPEFWHWAHLKLESTDNSSDFREQIFSKVREKGMAISMKHNWRYVFETVTPYYIEAECRFFRLGRKILVDINQLSGNRFEWAAIASHIRGETYRGRRPGRYTVKCTDKRLEIEPWMNEELFDLIGPDVSPVKLLSLLNDASPNIRRCTLRALYHCDTPFDISVVEPFTRGATTFIEKRIQHWANKIVRKGASVAHL